VALAMKLQFEEQGGAAQVDNKGDQVLPRLQPSEANTKVLRKSRALFRRSALRNSRGLDRVVVIPEAIGIKTGLRNACKQCLGKVLRLVSSMGKPSPCVVVRDICGDEGLSLARLLEQHSHGGLKSLKAKSRAHVRGHPESRRRISCPIASSGKMMQIADAVRDRAYRLVGDASLTPGSTSEQRRAAQKNLLSRGGNVHPYGMMYHPAYPGLGQHVDKGAGRYMVLFNLGLSCTFHCGSTSAREFEFEFKSGDALVFNDGKSHGALHGMPRIHLGTAPQHLPDWLLNVRVGLQFRQSKTKTN